MKTAAIALIPQNLPARTGSGCPGPCRARILPRERPALGDAPAVSLEIGSRDPEGSVAYRDEDLRWHAPEARGACTHQDGTPY